jgi:hypothetical protein
MIVNCDGCARQGGGRSRECRGCLVGALLDTPDGIADLTPGELRAIEVFELAGFEVELLETPPAPVAVPMVRPRGHVA